MASPHVFRADGRQITLAYHPQRLSDVEIACRMISHWLVGRGGGLQDRRIRRMVAKIRFMIINIIDTITER